MSVNSKEIGARIKELRIGHSLTQQQLAVEIGVTLNTISKIEPGMRVPSIDLFITLSEFFNVSLDYLIMGK